MYHNKFKMLSGIMDSKNLIPNSLMSELRKFSKGEKITPKSIGAMFIEHRNEVILNFGYAEKKSKIHADFKVKKIGNLSDGLKNIESKIEKIVAKMDNIICQTIFENKDEDIYVIFMIGKGEKY